MNEEWTLPTNDVTPELSYHDLPPIVVDNLNDIVRSSILFCIIEKLNSTEYSVRPVACWWIDIGHTVVCSRCMGSIIRTNDVASLSQDLS